MLPATISSVAIFQLFVYYKWVHCHVDNRKICQHGNNTGSYMDQELADIVPSTMERGRRRRRNIIR